MSIEKLENYARKKFIAESIAKEKLLDDNLCLRCEELSNSYNKGRWGTKKSVCGDTYDLLRIYSSRQCSHISKDGLCHYNLSRCNLGFFSTKKLEKFHIEKYQINPENNTINMNCENSYLYLCQIGEFTDMDSEKACSFLDMLRIRNWIYLRTTFAYFLKRK